MQSSSIYALLSSQEKVEYTLWDISGKSFSRYYFRDRKYPLRIISDRRCRGCHALFPKVLLCGHCKHVAYCSRKCQRDDWPEHQKRCYPESFYDRTKGAVLEVNHSQPSEEKYLRVLSTALTLIEQKHIHPDAIRMYPGINDWEDSYSAFSMNYEISPKALFLFLEYGLTPQLVIHHEFFLKFPTNAELSADILLEYGKGTLHFPLQDNIHAAKWLWKRGLDTDEIFSPKPHCFNWWENPAQVLFLASTGYDFEQSAYGDKRTIRDVLVRYNAGLDTQLKAFPALRVKTIRENLEEVLIPDLVNIILSYLAIRFP